MLAPVLNDQGPQGVVEVFQRPGARIATQRGYLRFLLQVCEFAGDFLKCRRLRHLSEKQSLWEQLETFTRTAHEKLDVRQTAYTIANEGRRLIGCDRVSVAIRRGGSCPIEAVSGQDTFDKRSNVTVMLGKLATAVVKTGEDVWYSGDTSDMAPQVEAALDAYVDESHTKAIAILPLTEPRDQKKASPVKAEPAAGASDRRADRRADGRQPHAGGFPAARRSGPHAQRHGAHQRAGVRRPVPDAGVAVAGQGNASCSAAGRCRRRSP